MCLGPPKRSGRACAIPNLRVKEPRAENDRGNTRSLSFCAEGIGEPSIFVISIKAPDVSAVRNLGFSGRQWLRLMSQ